MKTNDLETLLEEIRSIIDPSLPLVSNLSNVSALLNKMDDINWAGFYLNKDNVLYLGPFQGDVACTIIPSGKGVCGTSLKEKKSIIVDDVHKFEGHIACSPLSKSEIVVPIIKDNEVKAIIDIDAPIYNRFHKKDEDFLKEVANILNLLF